ncbi:MAG: AAA family ATPase [Corallococcus sp.]|nr:AAA family ATPase [Corallococcus sp.]
MKIISLCVQSFGKIKDVTLNFNDGINVVRKSNGFGKTTMANFIRAMLYGFTKSAKTSSVNDPSRYMPWNGADSFGGSMTVEHNGEIYRVERFFGKTLSKEKSTVTNVKTGKPVAFGGSFGEYLLGLTAESYDRSAYFPQESVDLVTNDKLDARLANLVENGAEDYAKIQKRLDDYKRNLQYKRGQGGKIFDLQTERNNLTRSLRQAEQAAARAKAIDARIKEIDERTRQIAKEQKENDRQLADLRKRLASNQPSASELANAERLRELNEKLNRMPAEFEQDKLRCDEIEREIKSLKNDVKPRVYPNKPLLIISVILALIGVALCCVPIPHYIGVIAGAVMILAGALGVIIAFTRKGAQTLPAGERDALVTQYYALAQKYICVTELDYDDARKALWKAYADYTGDLRERDRLRSVVPSGPSAEEGLEDKIEELSSRGKNLNGELISLSQEQGRLGEERKTLDADSSSIEDKILSVDSELERAREDFETASVVENLLAQAKDNLSTSYLPKLTARCQKLLNTVTDGRYEASIDRNFDVNLRENGMTKRLEEFSRGIREITFLCFRLALSELLYDGDIPFMVVDDSFVNYDEENFVRATDLLKNVASKGQVIYFTCHKRLGNLLK